MLVLDSNEYLFAFGFAKKPASVSLLNVIVDRSDRHAVRAPRLVITEIRRNLSGDIFREVLTLIENLTDIDEDFVVPFEIGDKYESVGLKPADALIAAYTEWVGAELLISENRHFLTRRSDLPFKVVTAEQALKIL